MRKKGRRRKSEIEGKEGGPEGRGVLPIQLGSTSGSEEAEEGRRAGMSFPT